MNKIIEKKLSGTTDPAVKEYEAEHRKLARKAAAEGMVLLENKNGLLPVPAGSDVALYGCGAAEIIKGGIGSGDVNEREVVSIVKGMTDAGYNISDPDWIEDYERKYLAARVKWKDTINDKVKKGGMQIFEAYSCTPFIMPAGRIPEKTKADYAIYFLSRIAGEGADRSAVKGDYYISDEEKEVLAEICRIYPKVIVAVNTGGLVDLSFIDEFKIGTLIYIMQPGMEAGNAFADVVSGRVTPSGKMTDTWAYHYEDYPNSATFSHNNGNTDIEIYEEGIYVGYRYFDSFHVPVRYCFGYGLSYTSFSTETEKVTVSGRGTENPMLTVFVHVKNTGRRFSGRETVQVYCSMPQKKFENEYRRLAGFGKTDELLPGKNRQSAFTSRCISLRNTTTAGQSG
jgi:beta-glucosidase